MKRQKKDILSHRDFNHLNRNNNPLPESDSPASGSENQLAEYLLGMEYGEESLEEMNDEGEIIPADEPAEPGEDLEESESTFND